MAIIMGKGCLEAIYGLMGWKGLKTTYVKDFEKRHLEVENLKDIQSSKNSKKDSHYQRR